MAQIIYVGNGMIVVELDGGVTVEVPRAAFDFPVSEMMMVDVHKKNDKYTFSPSIIEESESDTNTDSTDNADSHNTNANANPNPNNPTDKPTETTHVNKLPYSLLYFFFGGFGIHEFYAGNTKKGISWLVVTIVIYIFTSIPLIEVFDVNGLDFTLNYIRSYGLYGKGMTIYALVSWGYFILIRILAILSMCKK